MVVVVETLGGKRPWDEFSGGGVRGGRGLHGVEWPEVVPWWAVLVPV